MARKSYDYEFIIGLLGDNDDTIRKLVSKVGDQPRLGK